MHVGYMSTFFASCPAQTAPQCKQMLLRVLCAAIIDRDNFRRCDARRLALLSPLSNSSQKGRTFFGGCLFLDTHCFLLFWRSVWLLKIGRHSVSWFGTALLH